MANARSSTVLAGHLDTLYRLGTSGALPDDQLVERFLDRSDPAASEAAFRELVDRHGTMVLNVCQRILQNPHDAHDAFQATFLVLVQKAGAIRRRESVAGWLFCVARRIAVLACKDAVGRRRNIEKLRALKVVASGHITDAKAENPEPDHGDLLAEIDRLAETLRRPIVLHYFEGLSTNAIAAQLGCPRGTILSRLARARRQLRRRLEHRGASFEALMPATAAASRLFSNVAVPSALAHDTVRAATCLALAGTAIESVAPASVATLSRDVVRSLLFAKLRLASVLVILGIATAVIGLTMPAPADEKPTTNGSRPNAGSQQATTSQPTISAKTTEQTKGESVVVRGRVLDPDGKPVAGARIVLTIPVYFRRASSRTLAKSDSDGRFKAPIPRVLLDAPGPNDALFTVIGALFEGLGPDWVAVDARTAKKDITLRLRRDDVAIEGRVLGLEGRPVAGAVVSVAYIAEVPPELLKQFQNNRGAQNPFLWWRMNNVMLLGKDGLIPAVKTGPDGRFRLTGVGRDRLAYLIITQESIELSEAFVMTSSDPAYTPIPLPGKQKLWGPRFDIAAAPGRTIEGIVRDRDTGRPIAGVKVATHRWQLNAFASDAQGRYRVIGQPRGGSIDLEVAVEGQPYVSERIFKPETTTSDPAGLRRLHADFTLKRGIWVEGRVTNRDNGRPVVAVVRYHPLRDNPYLKAWPDATLAANTDFGNYAEFPTDTDGRFRAVALPGCGMLTVQASEPGYLSAEPLATQTASKVLYVGSLRQDMKEFHALVPINLGDNEKTVIPDITLRPGRTQHVQVRGPDGRPVPELRVVGPLSASRYEGDGKVVDGPEFTIVHAKPGTAAEFEVVQVDGSAGTLLQVKGDEPDPIRVTLQRTGTVTGRLVDEEARPRPFIPIMVNQHLKTRPFWRSNFRLTDAEGRFRITGLVPEIVYSLSAAKNHGTIGSDPDERYILNDRYRWVMKHQWAIKPGETQDWGDVQVQVNNR